MAWMEQLKAAGAGQVTACAVGTYILGCFTTGYYLVRARTGRDIRRIESGNVGARNVGRLLGKSALLLTALGDVGKGILAVWATHRFTGNSVLEAIALLAVVAGHIWPAQLRFHGGKGAATSLGALLIYDPQLTAAYVICFLAGFILLRKITLPGLLAFIALPFCSWWLQRDGFNLTIITALSLMVLFAHRRNIVEEFAAIAARRNFTAKPQPPKP
jgi:acyl phosphate:glycerol-3-phosphate acyltransferase